MRSAINDGQKEMAIKYLLQNPAEHSRKLTENGWNKLNWKVSEVSIYSTEEFRIQK